MDRKLIEGLEESLKTAVVTAGDKSWINGTGEIVACRGVIIKHGWYDDILRQQIDLAAPPSKPPAPLERHRQETQRSLPYSEDGEKGLLCSLLLEPAVIAPLCANYLSIDAFYVPAHRILYDTIFQWPKANCVDFTWLVETLGPKQLDEVGGKENLNALFHFVPTAANADYYLDLVLNSYRRRRAILFANRLAEICYDRAEEITDKLADWEQEFSEILHTSAASPEDELLAKYQSALVSFGEFCELDIPPRQCLLGDWLKEGDIGFVFGQRGAGKTWFDDLLITHVTKRPRRR